MPLLFKDSALRGSSSQGDGYVATMAVSEADGFAGRAYRRLLAEGGTETNGTAYGTVDTALGPVEVRVSPELRLRVSAEVPGGLHYELFAEGPVAHGYFVSRGKRDVGPEELRFADALLSYLGNA